MSATETMRFVCGSTRESSRFLYAQELYRRAFSTLGYELQMEAVGAQEALNELKAGVVDGDCGRILDFARYTGISNYVRVPSKLRSLPVAAWSQESKWIHELNNKRGQSSLIKIGYQKGLLGSQKLLQNRGFSIVVDFESMEGGLSALNSRKIDIWVDQIDAMEHIHYRNRPPHSVILQSFPLFPYLHQRHLLLVKEFGALLGAEMARLPYQAFKESTAPPKNQQIPENAIHFNCVMRQETPMFQWLYEAYRDAFASLDKTFYMTYVPAARAVANIKSGRVDGSCGRTLTFEQWEQGIDLIRIDVPVLKIDIRAWSHNPDFLISDIKEIQQGGYRVAYRRGLIVVESLFNKHPSIESQNTTLASQGIKMLAARRIDLYVDVDEAILAAIENTPIDIPLYDVGNLLSVPIYPFLHKRHAVIADAFTEHLRRNLSKDKTYLLE